MRPTPLEAPPTDGAIGIDVDGRKAGRTFLNKAEAYYAISLTYNSY